MKHNILTLSLATVLTGTVTFSTQAQALRTGYFSDSYLFRHQMNPALSNNSSYVSIPVIGNNSVDFSTNFGVKDFIYEKKGGGLTTFMNDEVSANKFLSSLDDVTRLNFNYDMSVISLGVNIGNGYYTLDANVHARSRISLDKDLFGFMKEMSSTRPYNFSDTRASAMGYADIALGHSRKILDFISVGIKLKYLVGLAYADADFDGSYASFKDEAWRMRMRGNLNVAGGGYFDTKEGNDELNGYEDFTPGINGRGFAVDLGASATLPIFECVKVSAALTDIGSIKWDCARAVANGDEFRFEGFQDTKIHSGQGTINPITGESGYTDGTIDEQWKRIEDDLENMTKLHVVKSGTIKERIGATATLGAEFEIPLYRKLSFGALYTQRFSKTYGFAEGRLIMNYAPSKAFDMALSGCIGSYGNSFGALLNLHVPAFNLFVGFDRMYLGSFNSDWIPLEKGGMNVSFGMNVPLGW